MRHGERLGHARVRRRAHLKHRPSGLTIAASRFAAGSVERKEPSGQLRADRALRRVPARSFRQVTSVDALESRHARSCEEVCRRTECSDSVLIIDPDYGRKRMPRIINRAIITALRARAELERSGRTTGRVETR